MRILLVIFSISNTLENISKDGFKKIIDEIETEAEIDNDQIIILSFCDETENKEIYMYFLRNIIDELNKRNITLGHQFLGDVYYKDIVVKINKTNIGIYVCDGENKNTTDSSVYGNYTKFNLSDSNAEFGIINVDNSLPGYAYLLIGIASTLGVCVIGLIITIVIKKKRAKKAQIQQKKDCT